MKPKTYRFLSKTTIQMKPHTEKAFSVESENQLACRHRKTEGIGRAKWPGTAGTTETVLKPHTYWAENIVHSHGSTKKALQQQRRLYRGASWCNVGIPKQQHFLKPTRTTLPVRQLRRHHSRNRRHSFHTGCPAQACFILLESLVCGQRMAKVVFYSFRLSASSTFQASFPPRKDLLVAHLASSEHSSHRLWGFPKNRNLSTLRKKSQEGF